MSKAAVTGHDLSHTRQGLWWPLVGSAWCSPNTQNRVQCVAVADSAANNTTDIGGGGGTKMPFSVDSDNGDTTTKGCVFVV